MSKSTIILFLRIASIMTGHVGCHAELVQTNAPTAVHGIAAALSR